MTARPLLIAEAKPVSPFGFRSDRSWEELFALACDVGDWVSVHTDPRWGGSFELLARARAMTDKPLLAKGIHATDEEVRRAFAVGADYALVVGRVPAVHADRCLIEPTTLAELAALDPALRAVWNSRDLATGNMKAETFAEARKIFSGWLCQASNLRRAADVQEGASAVLVGSNLERFAASWVGSARP